MYEATLSGPRLCWPGPRTKVRSRGRGAGNLDHRRRCFGAYRDSTVAEVDGIFCVRVCFGERILVLAPTERNVLRHCGCGDARYERYRARSEERRVGKEGGYRE